MYAGYPIKIQLFKSKCLIDNILIYIYNNIKIVDKLEGESMKKIIITVNIVIIAVLAVFNIYFKTFTSSSVNTAEIKNGEYSYKVIDGILLKSKDGTIEKQVFTEFNNENDLYTVYLDDNNVLVACDNKGYLYDLDLNFINKYNFDGNIIKMQNNLILYKNHNQITVFDFIKNTSNSFIFEVSSEIIINDIIIDESNVYFAGAYTKTIENYSAPFPFSAGYSTSGEKLFENANAFPGEFFSVYYNNDKIIFSGIKGIVYDTELNLYTPKTMAFKKSQEKSEGLLSIYNKTDFIKEDMFFSYKDYKYTMIHSAFEENGKLELLCSVSKDDSLICPIYSNNTAISPSKIVICSLDYNNKDEISDVLTFPSSSTVKEISKNDDRYIINIKLFNSRIIIKEFKEGIFMNLSLWIFIPLMNFLMHYQNIIIILVAAVDLILYFIYKSKKLIS